MPRLSEPMRVALEAAAANDYLFVVSGRWRRSGGGAWIDDRTIRALDDRGLLRRDGLHYVITPAGREAIGMKEGEGNGC